MVLKKAYVIGYPLGHSLSPDMHNAAYQALGLDYVYEKLELPELTPKTIDILRAPDCLGANVTVPHKKTAAQLVDELDGSARLTGSVNTVINRAGKLIGYSTDGAGYLESLKEAGIDPAGKKIIIFGTGGAAQAIIPLLQPLSKELLIVGIDSPRPDNTAISEADMIINATPLGMYPKVEATVLPDTGAVHSGQVFSDIVYNPRETLFLRNAAAQGATIHQGWGMLLYQGILAFGLLTGIERAKIPVDIMRQTLLSSL